MDNIQKFSNILVESDILGKLGLDMMLRDKCCEDVN
jgi:hypothetical protein